MNDEPANPLESELRALSERVRRLEEQSPPPASDPARLEARRQRNEELEGKLGTYWLSRIGIVSLISGVALLIVTYFAQLGPWLRVVIGYAVAAGLAAFGAWLSKRQRLFGQVVFGGGLAIGYFVTYALHFVRAMRVIESEWIGIALVAVAIVAIVAIAQRMHSETVAGVALFLGLHTGMITDVSALTLVCTSLLAAGAVFFVAKNRWVVVPLSTVFAVYATHATWAYPWPLRPEGPALSLAFLSLDFALFAAAALLRPDALRGRSLVLLALANWTGLTLLGALELWNRTDSALFTFLIAIAAVHALLAAGARLRGSSADHLHVAVALALVTVALALPARLTGLALVSGWAVIAVGAAFAARRSGALAMAILSWVVLAAALTHLHLENGTLSAAGVIALACLASERLLPGGLSRHLHSAFVVLVSFGLLSLAGLAAPSTLQTLAWVAVAAALFAGGFALRAVSYRWAAFAVLALAGLRLLVLDLRELSADERIVTFLCAGALLLAVSFVYARWRDRGAA